MTIDALPANLPSTSDPTHFDEYSDGLIAAFPTLVSQINATAAAMTLNATNDTSSSSVAIGTGAKTFTVTAGKSFQGGMFLMIADTAAPSTNSMYGQVTSYSGTTLVMNITITSGSGTKTAWTISQSSGGGSVATTATNLSGGSVSATTISGTTGTFSGAISGTTGTFSGALTSSSSFGGIGYGSGAGGTVTQTSTIGTNVTLNKITGRITTVSTSLSSSTMYVFSLNNSTITADSCVVLTDTTAPAGHPLIITAQNIQSGSVDICIYCTSAITAAPIINFVVIKAATA